MLVVLVEHVVQAAVLLVMRRWPRHQECDVALTPNKDFLGLLLRPNIFPIDLKNKNRSVSKIGRLRFGVPKIRS